ncbi:pyridoxamine 5'-phosphate oxidase family protein [Roseivivax isoporae]|uniref:Pyridoxamine 5'-phosphate oxidase n=1 Tax=Roseivivax isoporae LMG 25204 TaxID=1449351 RepID=X7FFW6_9RHOB|nr:pyridoxamine 5'-phosphate oxidase family protein [Roseivivax isoporae]ETX30904.1 pyridoxamine 5'-phosphate oxidase [Roseivivax isoporae LMG 25204]
MQPSTDIAFSPAVKAVQDRLGSRAAYARVEARGGWDTTISPDVAQFIAAQRSVFLATASADGQPYIQHRGGPPGFLKVLDERTLGMADLAGNRQYISTGNLSENPRIHLFLIDYANRLRVKIWGTARMVEDDPDLVARLMPGDGTGRAERALIIDVAAIDRNCPQHIPQRFEAADVARALETREAHIAELEAELARLGGA